MRSLTNFVLVITIFALGALFLSIWPFRWFGDVALGGVLFYLFFFVLEGRPIWIRCNHCGKSIATNTQWICGFCGGKNLRTREFPFVDKCEQCSAEPKAYVCHHCGELIFLTADELTANAARCLSLPKVDQSPDERITQEREKRAKEHELTMAELDDKLEAFRKRKEVGKKKTLQEDFEIEYTNEMAIHEFARKQKAANALKYRNDPEMLARANLVVDAWVERRAL